MISLRHFEAVDRGKKALSVYLDILDSFLYAYNIFIPTKFFFFTFSTYNDPKRWQKNQNIQIKITPQQ